MLADVVERADVRMIERRDRAGFALEALGERALDGLDGDVAIEPDVVGAIDVAHAAGSGGVDDFVRSEACAGS